MQPIVHVVDPGDHLCDILPGIAEVQKVEQFLDVDRVDDCRCLGLQSVFKTELLGPSTLKSPLGRTKDFRVRIIRTTHTLNVHPLPHINDIHILPIRIVSLCFPYMLCSHFILLLLNNSEPY